MAVLPVQVEQIPAGPLSLVGSFLVLGVLYSLTLHIAARYVLGDVPVKRALPVGAVLGLVSILLLPYGPILTFAATVAFDMFLVSTVYRLSWRSTAFVVAVHYTVTIIFGFTLRNVIQLLSTAPA